MFNRHCPSDSYLEIKPVNGSYIFQLVRVNVIKVELFRLSPIKFHRFNNFIFVKHSKLKPKHRCTICKKKTDNNLTSQQFIHQVYVMERGTGQALTDTFVSIVHIHCDVLLKVYIHWWTYKWLTFTTKVVLNIHWIITFTRDIYWLFDCYLSTVIITYLFFHLQFSHFLFLQIYL